MTVAKVPSWVRYKWGRRRREDYPEVRGKAVLSTRKIHGGWDWHGEGVSGPGKDTKSGDWRSKIRPLLHWFCLQQSCSQLKNCQPCLLQGMKDGAAFSLMHSPGRGHGISQRLCSFLAIHAGSCRQCPWYQFAGEFSTKAHKDLSHPTEKAVFLDGSLFMHEESWHWWSGGLFFFFVWFYFVLQK